MDGDISASTRVLEAVEREVDADVTELPPLYDALDTDALDALVESASDGALTRLEFVYVGYDVVVRGDGSVSVRPRSGGDAAGAE